MLKVAQDAKDSVDESRLEPDRWFVHQQDFRIHHQRTADFKQPPLAARQDFRIDNA
jgi:hypothetical protein